MWEKEKLLITSNFSFSHSVFKRLVRQTRKNQGFFGKELRGKKLLVFTILLKKANQVQMPKRKHIEKGQSYGKDFFRIMKLMGECNTILSANTLYRHLE